MHGVGRPAGEGHHPLRGRCRTERFDEDALRMLRAVRFSGQLGFAIEPETKSGIRATGRLEIRTVKRSARRGSETEHDETSGFAASGDDLRVAYDRPE